MKTSKSQFLLLLIFTLTLYQQSIQAQSGWILQSSIDSVDFYKIKFINQQTGFIVGGSNKIFKTTNSGEIWSDYVIEDSVNILNDIFFVNQTTGFIVGGLLSIPVYVTSIILKTTNSGNDWYKVYYDTNQNVLKTFRTIYFSDENTGFAGAGGVYGTPPAFGENYLFKTTNSGNSWTELSYNYFSKPRHMFFQSNSEGVAILESRILKTSNGGVNWVQIIQAEVFYGLNFLNNSTGYACGGNSIFQQGRSMIMKTTDSGNNWKEILNVSATRYKSLNSIYFTDVNTGYAVGFPYSGSAIILKTTNEGVNWGFQSSQPERPLSSIQFIDNNTGFAVGLYGTILKTTDGGGEIISGINNFSNELPEGFALHQNYPNPFNPSTTIKYEIPNKAHVSIKIYNVLGNEIESLINDVQNAGIYEVNWNAVNQPSGIYYYKIHTDRYSNTMKMLLLK